MTTITTRKGIQKEVISRPVIITTESAPQLTIISPTAQASVGFTGQSLAVRSSLPVEFTQPTIMRSLRIMSGSQVTRNLTTIAFPAASVGPATIVYFTPAAFGCIANVTDAGITTDEISARLPDGDALIASMTGAQVGDSNDIIIINATTKPMRISLTDLVNDVITPFDMCIASHSAMTVTAIVRQITAPLSVLYTARYMSTRNFSYYPTVGAFPAVGEQPILYVNADRQGLYGYIPTTTPNYQWVVGATGAFPDLPTALASPSVVNGDMLLLQNGTYTLAATLVIAKRVTIIGESRAGAILNTAGAVGDPGVMIEVQVGGVTLANMTIDHLKSGAIDSDYAVVASEPGGAPALLGTFFMCECDISFTGSCAQIRAADWNVSDCHVNFTGNVPLDAFAFIIRGVTGVGALSEISFENTGTCTQFIGCTATSDPLKANDIFTGTLAVLGCSQTGGNLTILCLCAMPINNTPGNRLSVFIEDNVTTETFAFTQFTFTGANSGDCFEQVSFHNNSISNAHEGGGGKGLFALVAAPGAVPFRTTPLPLHVFGNILGATGVHAGYTLATGAVAATHSCYYSALVTAASVVQDQLIPATPALMTPPTATSVTTNYTKIGLPRYATQTQLITGGDDLTFIDLAGLAVDGSTIAFKNRDGIILGVDYYTVKVGAVTRLIWQGAIAIGGPEALIPGDRISVTYTIA